MTSRAGRLVFGFIAAAALALVARSPEPGAPAAEGGAPRDASSPPILAGAAVRVITPVLGGAAAPVVLAGFIEGRIATGVRDDLSARALVLESGGAGAALVALDLYGMARADVLRIRDEVRARVPGLGGSSVLVACTRDHAAPDITGEFTPSERQVDALYVGRVVRLAAEAVEEAWKTRQPARLSFASARLPRSLRDARQPLRIDDVALLVRIESADGRIGIAAVAGFAGSPETLGRRNTLISADYPGSARSAVENAFGGVALFFTGASGGLMVPSGDVGGELARTLLAAWSRRAESPGDRSPDATGAVLAVRWRTFDVPLQNRTIRAALAQGRRRARPPGPEDVVTTEAAILALAPAPGGRPLVEFACVPGAIYPELAQGGIQDPQDPAADLPGEPLETPLRSLLRAPVRFVVGTCGDDLGEFIPASQWDEKPPFAYGLTAAQIGEATSPGPRAAQLLMEAFRDLAR